MCFGLLWGARVGVQICDLVAAALGDSHLSVRPDFNAGMPQTRQSGATVGVALAHG
jgi:hypothetical protein